MKSVPVDWAERRVGTATRGREQGAETRSRAGEGKGQAGLEKGSAQAGGVGVGVLEDGESAA